MILSTRSVGILTAFVAVMIVGVLSFRSEEPGSAPTPLQGRVLTETCGDGILEECEECDDGNAPDGCGDFGDGTCRIPDNYNCDGTTCTPCGGIGQETCDPRECGDGSLNSFSSEFCDDGNNENGDGCDQYCGIEEGCTCFNTSPWCAGVTSDCQCGCEEGGPDEDLVENGDFESGYDGFTTGTAINDCSIMDDNTYCVAENSLDLRTDPSVVELAANGGEGNMLIVNGGTSGDSIVWDQVIAVQPGETYSFSMFTAAWIASNYANLEVWANCDVIASGEANTPGSWAEMTGSWNSGSATAVRLQVINRQPSPSGNDFALDDISFEGSKSCEDPGDPEECELDPDDDECTSGACCDTDTNTFMEAGTSCRDAVDQCDVAESCPGNAANCPANTLQANGFACTVGQNAGDCQAGSCTITGGCWLNGAPRAAGTVCRAAGGPCDVREVCDGTNAACPADAVSSDVTLCAPAAGFCDIPEYCNGALKTCPVDVKKGSNVQCRASSNDKKCDPAEFCTGLTDLCPADVKACIPLKVDAGNGITKKPMQSLDELLGSVTGGTAPVTIVVTGLPPEETPGYSKYAYSRSGLRVTGKVPVGAANKEVFGWSRFIGALTGEDPGGPNPNGREYTYKITATDADGETKSDTATWKVNPLVTDVDVNLGCACFEGTRNCDVHAKNEKGDPVPEMTITKTSDNLTYNGDLMAPAVIGPGQQLTAGAPASTQVDGDTITWSNNGNEVVVGGEQAAWPNETITDGNSAAHTATATTKFNIDPNPDNNTETNNISNQCDSKTVNPEGPVCKDDTLLYVISIGRTGVSAFNFTDPLHPCLNPATVTALTPSQCQVQGQAIVCTAIPISNQMPTAMISFSVKPKASCAFGTDITNTGTATFPQGGANTSPAATVTTTNRFCPCDDKSNTCSGSSKSSKSSSSNKSSSSSKSSGSSSSKSSSTSSSSSSSNSSSSNSSSSTSSRSSAGLINLTFSSTSNNSSGNSASNSSTSNSSQSSTSNNSSGISASASTSTSSTSNSSQSSSSQSSTSNNFNSASNSNSSFLLSIIVPSATSASSLPPSFCANNLLELPEECDDGNLLNGDNCSAVCLLEQGICGDGVIQRLFNEQCEPSIPSDITCSGSCRYLLANCGDNKTDPGEACDLGTRNSNLPNAACRPDCSVARCSDRILDPGESCDDGNRVGFDGCSSTCQIEREAPSSQGTLPAQVIDLPLISACTNDSQCTSNYCTAGECQQCASNNDCGTNRLCLNGTCEVASCTQDSQCPSTQRCVRGQCGSPLLTGTPCFTNAQCAPDLMCLNGICANAVAACSQDSQCPVGYACISGQCIVPANTAPNTTDSGPETLALMAAGAAAGYAWIRRRRR